MPSTAQDVTGDGESMVVMEEIVVTARRREETLIQVPESINVFTSQAIEDAEIDSIDDFARLTPGAVVQQGFQGGDRPIIVFRGVGQIGGVAPSVLILTDGIYAPFGDSLRNQMYDIERIEVVKGPQGALYGRDSIGGLINVITKAPGDEFGGELQAYYQDEDNARSIAAAVNLPVVDERFRLRLSGSKMESDGFFKDLNGRDHDTRDESFARARALLTPSESLTIDFRLSGNSFDNGGYNAAFFAYDANTYIADVGNVLNAVDYPDGFNHRNVTDAALKVDWLLGDLELTLISQYVDSDQTLKQDADFQLAPGLNIVRTGWTGDRSWSEEIRLASGKDQHVRWLLGGFYEDNRFSFAYADEELNFLGPLGGGSNATKTSRYAAFGQLDWDLTQRFAASLALRYDKANKDLSVFSPDPETDSTDAERTSPKVSLSYRVAPGTSVYATYGEGFRSGGFDPVTNIPYKDEVLRSLELGLKSSLIDNRLFVTAAAYRIKYTDQQIAIVTTDPRTGGLITTTVNLAESSIKGLELGASYTAGGLELSGALDFLDSTIEKDPDAAVIGNHTPFSTDYTVNVAGQYTWKVGATLDLKLRAEYYYQGDQYWNKANTLIHKPYGLLSTRIALEAKNWSLAVSGQNILDQEFNDQLFADFAIPGLDVVYPGLPARWRISTTWNF